MCLLFLEGERESGLARDHAVESGFGGLGSGRELGDAIGAFLSAGTPLGGLEPGRGKGFLSHAELLGDLAVQGWFTWLTRGWVSWLMTWFTWLIQAWFPWFSG